MRQISANGLAKLAEKLGTEPIFIIEVDWGGSGGAVPYADRDVDGIPGKILDVSEMDNVIDVLNNNSSQEITITLDDTDGSIKHILDTQDVHQRNVSVYQHFDGLDLSDKFLLFTGKLTSPVVWSEAERTVTFSVLSQLEDKEIGFSAEEGQFPFIPKDLVGKPWPIIFGKCLDVPALQINKAVSGTTLCGIGILSGADLHNQVPLGAENCSLGISLAMMSTQISFLNICGAAWQNYDSERSSALLEQANDLRQQIAETLASASSQQACATSARAGKVTEEGNVGCNPVRILGGEDFPQDTPIQLNINGGLFTGIMHEDEFTISDRQHPDNDEKAQDAFDGVADTSCEEAPPAQTFDFAMDVPCGTGDFLNNCQIRRHGFILCETPTKSRPSVNQVAQHFWAEPGSRVVMASDEPITYIVSITPGEVLAVKAYKDFFGERRLVNVPTELYEVETQTYGSITAVQVVLRKPLSTIVDQGWSDDIYVTFESTVGPNIVEIMEYIIQRWTDLTTDAASFAAVQSKVNPFPANFPILDRKNTIEVLREIAFQARCAIWISNGKFYLKYLPEEPTSDSDITASDIQHKSISVELTPTEDLVTKIVATWRLSWADGNGEEPEKIILRHNVNKYGTKEREFDFYIYNQPDIVLKAATFWLIRLSKTWKKIKFKAFLNKLNLETFDTINFQHHGIVADDDVKAIVETASYDSNDQTVNFVCLTPVKAGTTEPYIFFWPKNVGASFPTAAEISAGNAGGGGIGANASGNLPVGDTSTITAGNTVFVGGPNIVFRDRTDRGDPNPGDVGFTAQTVIAENVFAEIDNTPNPDPDLTLNYVDPLPAPVVPPLPSGGITIDIRKTRIIDSDNEGVSAFLDTIIRKIDDDALFLNTDAKFSDGSNDSEFDFEFDDEGGKWGAGTAFLQD
jgi:hypothetical protein